MTNKNRNYSSWVLILLGVAYLILLSYVFIGQVDLAANRTIQYILHPIVILTAIAYVLFANEIYIGTEDKANARLALLFASGFSLPVLTARCVGLSTLTSAGFQSDSLFNFYSSVTVIMPVEVAGWTTLFPLSMLFLGRVFLRRNRLLGCLCFASSACCFTAFLSFFTSSAIFFFIGVTGWGTLFLAVVLVYLIWQRKEKRKSMPVK